MVFYHKINTSGREMIAGDFTWTSGWKGHIELQDQINK
jgi:hypothetical protein